MIRRLAQWVLTAAVALPAAAAAAYYTYYFSHWPHRAPHLPVPPLYALGVFWLAAAALLTVAAVAGELRAADGTNCRSAADERG